MENATKALLIAGGVLIAIIILTIGVTLYSMYSNQSKEYNQIITTTEIQKFNSKFDAYVGRTDITAQEVVSVVNLAKEYNDIVTIKLEGSILKFNTITPEQFIKQNLDETFSCQNPEYDSETGKITRDKIYKE
ncbi:MAG: hypothetical protein ACI4VP_00810 [Clostridia bacterium]